VPSTTLEALGLSKSFGGPPLFSGLSFVAEKGLIAVTGRNGSGKTTLLKILAGLARASGGSVRVRRGAAELAGRELQMTLGWAGPDLAFYEDFTAIENLRFFRRAAGAASGERELVERLEAVGLAPAAGQRVGEFSTGMTQRLRIAFALLFDSPLLLLDEPLAGLDSEGRERVLGIVAGKRRAGAVVLASNDPRDFASPEQEIRLGGSL